MATTTVAAGTTRRTLDWRAAVWAGVIAGAIFMVLEMLMVQVFLGMSMWGPPRMIAAIAMGQDVLPPPDTFAAGILMVAMIVHFVLSILFAIPLAWLVDRTRLGLGGILLVGSVFGLSLYLINFYPMTAFFPWFAMARNWVSIVTHILFGAIASWAYLKLRKPGDQVVTPRTV